MMNNFIPILQTERNIKHLSCLPLLAMQVELNLTSLIHPTGEEDINKMLEGFDQITFSNPYKNAIDLFEFKNHSGIYGIRCGKKNNYIYIGETIRSFEERIGEHFNQHKNNTHSNKRFSCQLGQSSEITIYFFEHCEANVDIKLKLKTYCLLREYYYQELFLMNGFKLSSREDSLHTFFTCGLFGHVYKDVSPCKLLMSGEFITSMKIEDTCYISDNSISEQDLKFGWELLRDKFYQPKHKE